jgi:hypothetical protein
MRHYATRFFVTPLAFESKARAKEVPAAAFT